MIAEEGIYRLKIIPMPLHTSIIVNARLPVQQDRGGKLNTASRGINKEDEINQGIFMSCTLDGWLVVGGKTDLRIFTEMR